MRGTIIPKTNTNTIEPTDDNNENAAANNNDLFFERKIQEATAVYQYCLFAFGLYHCCLHFRYRQCRCHCHRYYC
jgi:hypothetical protein